MAHSVCAHRHNPLSSEHVRRPAMGRRWAWSRRVCTLRKWRRARMCCCKRSLARDSCCRRPCCSMAASAACGVASPACIPTESSSVHCNVREKRPRMTSAHAGDEGASAMARDNRRRASVSVSRGSEVSARPSSLRLLCSTLVLDRCCCPSRELLVASTVAGKPAVGSSNAWHTAGWESSRLAAPASASGW